MVNHLRNLLLNLSGTSNPGPDFPGEQYVPPDFVPTSLPGPLNTIWTALFGSRPDRAMLNWRLQEYLTCVHAAGLDGFVTALDPRITYWPFNNSLMQAVLQGPTYSLVYGNSQQQLYFSGAQVGQIVPAANRLFYKWKLEVISNSTVQLTQYDDAAEMLKIVSVAYTLTNGLSSPIPLAGTPLSVSFTPGVGTAWNIQVVTQPAVKMLSVITTVQNTLNDLINTTLFPAGSDEPYKTFSNLWNESNQLPLQVAGLILGLGYAIDNVE